MPLSGRASRRVCPSLDALPAHASVRVRSPVDRASPWALRIAPS